MFIDAKEFADADERLAAFAGSDMFERMFHEGMDLVSETANYLDGDGRAQSRDLDRAGALAYASESMRLTTRLMQASSWLLVQRAVREGEMAPRQAMDPKYRLGARRICLAETENPENLPPRLVSLLDRASKLYQRIDRLDQDLLEQAEQPVAANAVGNQWAMLQAALGA